MVNTRNTTLEVPIDDHVRQWVTDHVNGVISPIMSKLDNMDNIKYEENVVKCGKQDDAHKVFDKMSMNEILQNDSTVQEYFDAFSLLIGDKDRDERYLIDLFICGLHPGIKEKVHWYRPRSLSNACSLAGLEEARNKLLKKMDEKRDKLFSNCSRGFVKMDGVDGEKVVKNRFKLNKIDETHVGVHCFDDPIMDFARACDSRCEESEVDVYGGVVDCEEDGKAHELCKDIVDGSSGIEEDSDAVIVIDDDCKENKSRVSGMDGDNELVVNVLVETWTENIGLKSYGESCKDIIGKEIECLGLISPNEFDEELNRLVELKDKNKCLEVTDNLVNEKDETEGGNKRMGLSSLICSGEIVNGAKGCERNEINVSSLVNECNVVMNSSKGDWTSNFNKPVDIIKECSVEQKEGRRENNKVILFL
ncbi:hypothetical protein Tco_1235724, partial [Tanacetum coccineum]